ncbi:uncharacterized protein Z518_06971 [Rhinocladiella mackenziei CBS 650.93]|uniref:chitin deacetylase n=1 Tax=Rhinocladiella mackenziei CBS 650.93 TaxID=1442369 RepID=A0A0D2IC79_9EURO|nr:uncharacterized protein Z518_06971 [Rhinocladiella mackenziei CBS 650.93]KIX03419.1 hypothetical protein Z518_06971 [Rhinocladiella mackenziei CBS 650.93]
MSILFLFLIVFSFIIFPLLYIIYKPPACLIQLLTRRWPDVLFQLSIKQRIVALTIDDGPSPYTSAIQHILDTSGAKATFFVIGSHIPGHENILTNLILNNHELANHAVRDEPSRSLPTAELISQIKCVESQVGAIYASLHRQAAQPRYFRPGSGFFSTSMRQVLRDLDYRLVLGNIYPHDAQISFWRLNAWHILSMVRPGGIIVCHDRKWTPSMLRTVLPELKRRGYEVVTVTELLNAAES